MGVPVMPTAISPAMIVRARRLRRDMTDGERRLWAELRHFRRWYGIHVRRQAPVGPYVADFIIHDRKLIIEVDGEHHLEPSTSRRDRWRDSWFEEQGYRVVRFNTGELAESFEGCVTELLRLLGLMESGDAAPTSRPFPKRGRPFP